MIFKDSYEMRHCITNYAVAKGKAIKFHKMCKKKVIAYCTIEGCKWRCYASKRQKDNGLQVKSYNEFHGRRCVFNFKVNIGTSRWLAIEYKEELRKDPR